MDTGLSKEREVPDEEISGNKSALEFTRSKKVIPGGVNSPVRSFKSVGGSPLFFRRAAGSRIYDIDHREYIDFCLSWGVHILGHGNRHITDSVSEAIRKGTSLGMPTPGETLMAEGIAGAIPSIEMVRLVSSGTEAVMSAIRLARAFTGRNKIIKFDGCYHGHSDNLLVSAGSGLASLGISSTPGVPEDFVKHTISLPFNDPEKLNEAFIKYRDDIAAVIVEPVPANMGVVLPQPGFLRFIRDTADEMGSLLIFDEVITGFRPERGGAQKVFNIVPDLTTLGKIIGGGFPIGAYGGRREIMSMVAPEGNVYQAGTLSGNPVAVAAGLATLELLRSEDFFRKLNKKADDFIDSLKEVTRNKGISVNSFRSMFTLFFNEHEPKNCSDVQRSDSMRFGKFYRELLNRGVFFSPSQFEANFISEAHSVEDLNRTLECIKEALKRV